MKLEKKLLFLMAGVVFSCNAQGMEWASIFPSCDSSSDPEYVEYYPQKKRKLQIEFDLFDSDAFEDINEHPKKKMKIEVKEQKATANQTGAHKQYISRKIRNPSFKAESPESIDESTLRILNYSISLCKDISKNACFFKRKKGRLSISRFIASIFHGIASETCKQGGAIPADCVRLYVSLGLFAKAGVVQNDMMLYPAIHYLLSSERQEELAKKAFCIAAALGNPIAQYELGCLSKDENSPEAQILFDESAQQNYSPAKNKINLNIVLSKKDRKAYFECLTQSIVDENLSMLLDLCSFDKTTKSNQKRVIVKMKMAKSSVKKLAKIRLQMDEKNRNEAALAMLELDQDNLF